MLLTNEEQAAFRPQVVQFAQPYLLDNATPLRSAVWKLAEDYCGTPAFLATRADQFASDSRTQAHAFYAWKVLKGLGFDIGNLG